MKYLNKIRRKHLERKAERIYLDECEAQANILLIAQFDKSESFQIKNDRMGNTKPIFELLNKQV